MVTELKLTKMNLHHSQESENRKNKLIILDGRGKGKCYL